MDNLTDEKVCEFLDRLSNLGHCYDGETEVLTKKGFVKWPNVNEDTEFATVDPKSRNFTGFEKATQLFNYDYSGEMIKISHHDVDLRIGLVEERQFCAVGRECQHTQGCPAETL